MSAVSMMAEQLPSHTQNNIVQLHQQFHPNHGTLVQLSENCLSAFRLRPSHEFNQGLVFSSRPLRDDQVFEVRIDRKVYTMHFSSMNVLYADID